MELLGVGAAEALVVFVITLIVVGPNRFPEIARQSGRYYRIARRYAAEVTADVRGAMAELEAEVESQKSELEAVGTELTELSEGISETVEETRGDLHELDSSTQQAVGDPLAAGGGAGNGTAPAPTESAPPAPGAPAASGDGLITPRDLPAADEGTQTAAERPTDGE